MSQPIEDLIARLLNLFGPPNCDDPAAYIDEVRAALKGYGEDLIRIAGDKARDECIFFPRPAELRAFMQKELEFRSIGRPRDAFEQLDEIPPPDPETVARVNDLVAKAKLHMMGLGPKVDAFGDKPARLSETSRRIMGETGK